MKKITSFLLLLLTSISYSQINTYKFSQGTSTYTEIGGTSLGNETSYAKLFVDPSIPLGGTTATGVGLPIGFTFKFNGVNYNRFGISQNGWIGLGTTDLTPAVDLSSDSPNNKPISSIKSVPQNILSARISALGYIIMPQTGATLQYETIGTAPNRTLVVQWKNYRRVSAVGESYNFQIRLNEGSNTVNLVYGNFSAIDATGLGFQVGLRTAPSETLLANYNNRTSTAGWNNTTVGTSASDIVKMENNASIPTNGLTFTWTPPVCGVASGFTTSKYTTSSVDISWSPLGSAPASGYEYIISDSATTPLASESGTKTTNTSASITGKNPNTTYYVYFRSNCGSEYTQWALLGTFKTYCPESTELTQNFDSTPITGFQMPDCWTRTLVGVGFSYVNNTKSLFTYASQNASPPAASYSITPLLSNLQLGTHRIRFKANNSSTSDANCTISVGYLTETTNPNTYVNLKSFPTSSAVAEFSFIPTDVPVGIKNLVFRNFGANGVSSIYIDDVFWEIAPTCSDVSGLKISATTADGKVNLSWTASSMSDDAQYVYSTSATDNPDILPLNTLTGNTALLNLNPGTFYKVWVRSKCTTTNGLGNWQSITFTTPCTPVQTLVQDFDAGTSLPTCWAKLGGGTGDATSDFIATTPPNVLRISTSAIVRLPALSNAAAGTHRLRFKYNVTPGPFETQPDAKLEIGYLTDAFNANSFVSLQQLSISPSKALDANIILLETKPQSPFLAFRSSSSSGVSSVKIDDLVWEPIPTCPDLNVKANLTTDNSATIGWDLLGGNATYQYAYGSSNLVDPNSLTPTDISTNSVTIAPLNPASSYKAWVRSVCHGSDYGAWMGPVIIKTNCNPVDLFSDNFDSSLSLSTCWSTPSLPSSVYIINTTQAASVPNELVLGGGSIIAMPPVTPSPLGIRHLKFKFKGSAINSQIEVGFLSVSNNPNSFMAVKTYSNPSTSSWKNVIADLETTSQNQVLAFRGKVGTTLYIDDVIWEIAPQCPNIDNLINLGTTNNSVNLTWAEGGTESAWQYVLGSSTVSDPETLTPVDVDSSTILIDKLTSSTKYKIWVRSKCGDDIFGQWIGGLSFSTTCDPVNNFHENFDSNTNIPNCWMKSGNTGTVQISATNGDTPTLPNSLFLYSGSENSRAIITMPLVTNADQGTHRLRFKARASNIGAKLEVGYMTSNSDPNSFVTLKTFTSTTLADFESYIAEFGSEPKSQTLAFRNAGAPASTIYVDDVYWEAIPTCQDVTNVVVSSISNNNVELKWNTTTSNNYQYVIDANTVSEPNTLLAKDISTNSINLDKLAASTTYRVWLRNKCSDTSFGVWIGPVIFTTSCDPVSEFSENFDSSTSIPTCWKRSGTLGGVYVADTPNAPSSSNTLVIYSDINSGQGLVAMPAINNFANHTHRLSFKAKANFENSVLEVGYLTNVANPNTFVALQVVTVASNTTFKDYILDFHNNLPLSQILAFRNVGNDGTYIYLDNVNWQPIPQCADVVNPNIALVKSTTANIIWDQNAVGKWQYALGESTDNNPDALTAVTVENFNITIDKLTPSKSYKVWLRSKCSDTTFGYWVGPLTFETTCTPITTFTEKFDDSTSLPTCWKKSGEFGNITITPNIPNNLEVNALTIFSGNTINQGVVAMPPVSNSAAGTQKLKFKAITDVLGTILEIGYLKDISDPKSFVSLQNRTINSTTKPYLSTDDPYYVSYMVDLGTLPQSEVLAFRNSGNKKASSIYIENVIWDETVIDLGVETMDSVNFSYYPNPVRNILNLSYNQNITSVSVFNLLGQEVIAKSLNTEQTSIDMSNLTNGAYLIKVTAQNQVKTIKVIKE